MINLLLILLLNQMYALTGHFVSYSCPYVNTITHQSITGQQLSAPRHHMVKTTC